MGLSEPEKKEFITLLEQRGWNMKKGTIWAPGGGLWFSEPHFDAWTLKEIIEIHERRAERVKKSEIGNWKRATKENLDASEAASEIQNKSNTQP